MHVAWKHSRRSMICREPPQPMLSTAMRCRQCGASAAAAAVRLREPDAAINMVCDGRRTSCRMEC